MRDQVPSTACNFALHSKLYNCLPEHWPSQNWHTYKSPCSWPQSIMSIFI